eukprot:CAMPEP_0117550350 /NCGR_PEP_ID=MMETSP0784-20121206/48635_1 /TAXON_ID=39447 /ORGANISM="" /LENGTH=138 /DNA_ID=CAMNT_0005347365 /DNA_START=16 /DNA_END=432 /DNA_ORIENTATION=-
MAQMKASIPFVGERPNKQLHGQGMADKGAEDGQARHPVERLLIDSGRRAEQQEMMALSLVHGQHAPIRLKVEREMLSQFQRLPGLPSSFVGLQTVLDLDETIEFEDVFNLEQNAPMSRVLGPNCTVHDVMETRLNMRF